MCRLQLVVLIGLILLVLCGCGDQRVLERLGVTQTTSFDLAPQEEQKASPLLVISNSIPRPDSVGGNTNRELLTATAHTSKEGRIKLARQTELMLVSGQLRNTLFGISLAQQGIWEHIDTFVRDTSISPRVKVTIVNGSATQLLAQDYPQHSRTGQYLDRLLEKEADAQTIPEVSLYRFTKDYLDDGIDPVAPIVKATGEHLTLDGIALFQDDRYVTNIQPDQALIFAFLRGKFKHGEMNVNLSELGKENEQVMLSSVTSNNKIKITSADPESNRILAEISIMAKGSVLEYTGELRLDKPEDQQKLEKLIAQYIKLKAEEMIAMMQVNGVDSIGLGKYVRNKLGYERWKQPDWYKLYPSIKVNCHVSIRIKDYGKFVNVVEDIDQ